MNPLRLLAVGITSRLEALHLTSVIAIPERIDELTSLRELVHQSLSLPTPEAPYEGWLKRLPRSLTRLPRLSVVTVQVRDGRSLPPLPACERLTVAIASPQLADVFDRMPALGELSLDAPALERLPESLAAADELTSLTLARVEALDWEHAAEVLAAVPRLRRLALRGVPVLPAALGRVTQLRSLFAHAARVDAEPLPDLTALAQLTHVEVDGEALGAPAKRAFQRSLPGTGWRRVQHTRGFGGVLTLKRDPGTPG